MENNILPDDIQKKVDEVAQRYESPAIFKEGVFYAFACAKIMAEKELSTLNAQQGAVNWVKASERLPDTSGYYHVKRKVIKSTEQEKDVQYYLAEASRFSWDNVIWWLDESPNAYQELKEKVSELEVASSEASGYIEFLDVQNNRLRKVLFELVHLKDRKDKEGDFLGYSRLKQLAWAAAREVVKDLNNPDKLIPASGSNLLKREVEAVVTL